MPFPDENQLSVTLGRCVNSYYIGVSSGKIPFHCEIKISFFCFYIPAEILYIITVFICIDLEGWDVGF